MCLKALCRLACLWLFTSASTALGQLEEDFSDGDLVQNPSWEGDLSYFAVNSAGELQLMAPQAGFSVLAVKVDIPDSALWQIDIRLAFAPSANNLLRIYLMADQPNLLQASGYYLEIGENGNADAIRFFRQTGAARTLLSSGTPGLVAFDPVAIRLQVRRSTAGLWSIAARKPSGGYSAEGSATDAAFSLGAGRYFGFYCLYTETRRDKFFFDNISIRPDIPDTQPPILLSASAGADGEGVLLTFNEELDTLSALEPAHYAVIGQPPVLSAQFAGRSDQVYLQLAHPLSTGSYEVQCQQVADLAGNVSGLQSAFFSFVRMELAQEFDILINEIMADPTPSAGLPEVEWVELHNRSQRIVDLSTLYISDGGTPRQLPAFLLYPDSFAVLTTMAGAGALAPYAPNVLAVSGFPSLNNTGDTLLLLNADDQVLERVSYSSGWHTDQNKREGGWSLERINPNLPCLGRENWTSCPILPGGTPGRQNAAFRNTSDTTPPRLLAVFPLSDREIELSFSEPIERTAISVSGAFGIFPPHPTGAAVVSATQRHIAILTLPLPLDSSVVYQIWATPVLSDCAGNPLHPTDTFFVGIPQVPEPFDIVVNEVLFNPETFGSDFVELYNRSEKIFNLSHFFIANFYDGSAVQRIGLRRLFLPQEYLVFTPNPEDIRTRFARVRAENLFSLALPSLPDNAGNVTVFWAKDGREVVVDSFVYFDTYHNALLNASQREGVSLERIRVEGATNDPANWTSAAQIAGSKGTPTQPNSQRLGRTSTTAKWLQLAKDRLSPDGDGYEDFLDIWLQLPGPGYAATVIVFDGDGTPVRYLLRHQVVGQEAALRWDGDAEDGTIARPGIYLLHGEAFSPQGVVLRERLPFAVVRRF